MNRQELIEAIDGLEVFDMSYYNGDMRHLPRKNFYINKYQVLSLIDKLDDIPEGYEVLSENWIEENRLNVELTDSFNINCVVVSKLKNLLIPTQPEKVKLPKFVADEIERAQGEGVSLYDAYYTTRKLEGNLDEWMSTENNDELYARAWLDGYEIEPKRYCIPLPNLVTTDGEQQYLTHKGDKFFASRKNEDLRQTWKKEDLKYVPEEYHKYAVEVE